MAASWPTTLASYAKTAFHKTANLNESTLVSGISAAATSLETASVTTKTAWPADTYVLLIEDELLYCDSRAGVNHTVNATGRGFGGTTAATHSAGVAVYAVAASEFLAKLADEIIAMQGNPGFAATQFATKTAAYTVLTTDVVLLGDATTAAFTFTLPTAVGKTGRVWYFKKIDSSANAVTVDGNGAETIDGAATYALNAQHDAILIISDGTNWRILGKSLASSMMTFTIVTANTTLAVDNGYITNSASKLDMTLPAVCAAGKRFRVAGRGTGGWKVKQNAGQVIHVNNVDTTTGTGGSVESNHRYDSLELLCILADTEFVVLGGSHGPLGYTVT